MRLTIAYFKIKKRNLVLIHNATYQKKNPLSERPIRQPLIKRDEPCTNQRNISYILYTYILTVDLDTFMEQ